MLNVKATIAHNTKRTIPFDTNINTFDDRQANTAI